MAPPVSPALPDTQPPAEARGWTQKYKDNTVSVLDLFNRLMKSSALRDTYRLKLDVTRKVVLVVCLMCGANLFCCNLSNVQSQHDKHCKQRPAAEQPPPLPNPTGAAGAAAYAEGPGPNNEPAHVAAAPSTNSAPSRAHYVEGTSFKAYTREGVPVTLHQVASAMQQHDVVLLGEYHDDPVAHHCQLRLWKAALRLCGLPPVAATGHVGRVLPPPWLLAHPHSGEGGAVRPTTSSDPAGAREPGLVRPAVLSLEMFETDTQVVMDEFLKGIVREQDLVVDGRAWPNYMRDYRPLVLAAKQHGAGVVCANAPRRLVSYVGRHGSAALPALPAASLALLPPLPHAPPSAQYKDKINAMMAMARQNEPAELSPPTLQPPSSPSSSPSPPQPPQQPLSTVPPPVAAGLGPGQGLSVRPAAGHSLQPEEQQPGVMAGPQAQGKVAADVKEPFGVMPVAAQTNSMVPKVSLPLSPVLMDSPSLSGAAAQATAQQQAPAQQQAAAIQQQDMADAQGQAVQPTASESQDKPGADTGGSGKECPYIGLSLTSNFYDAQNLWDVSMAHNISRALRSATTVAGAQAAPDPAHRAQECDQPLVVHLCGKAHCEQGLGVIEHLTRYEPAARVMSVVFLPAHDVELSQAEFRRESLGGIADYVVLTDGSLPRSFPSLHPV
ncbi:hypothetical protein V8C86DRAFT_563283 [Haematococcus lacustris]